MASSMSLRSTRTRRVPLRYPVSRPSAMHKLRHRFGTRGYAGTGNLRAVQEALGHASVATTQRYVAVSARDVRAVSEAAAGN